MDTEFVPIDLDTWPRAQEYHFFKKIVPLGFTLTVDLDVTNFKITLKEHSVKFFPAFIWLLTKALNQKGEFRVIEHEGVVGQWNELNPMYPVFHEDDKSISIMWTKFDESFPTFYTNYQNNFKQYIDNHGFFSQPDSLPPANCYVITQLPWMNFKHFAFHLDMNKAHLPLFAIGKFNESDDKIMMPFSVTVNHSAVDGWHVHSLIDYIQHEMDNPENWIDEDVSILINQFELI